MLTEVSGVTTVSVTVRPGTVDIAERIRAAAAEVRVCEDALDAARERLRTNVQQAIDEGVSWRATAAAAGQRSQAWIAKVLARRSAAA